jgi:eukaryotic-like serine/threonine-protein kinase
VMNPGMGQDADAISRFNREASNASRINHPHVAGIYDFGETPDGLIYLAMEYVEGEPLTNVVEASGALPPARAAEITRQAAEALAVAHEMGIVHRDLKPDNIMLAKNRDGSDCVKVVDFGIAKAAGGGGDSQQKVTKTGLVVGTPEYMSPEQLAGDALDGRSDVYSLALVAFNMLTGQLPFPSETQQEAMIMRLTDKPKTLAEMRPQQAWPAAVQAVMDRALERDVKARWQSASEFGRALHAAVAAMPAPAGEMAGTLVMGAATTTVPRTRVSASEPPAAAAAQARAVEKKSSRVPMLVGGSVAAVLVLGGALWWSRAKSSITLVTEPVPAAGANTAAATSAPPGATPATVPLSAPLRADVEPAGQPVPAERRPDERAGERAGERAATPPVSYARELSSLLASVGDPASARQAEQSLETYRARATTAGDRAAIALISGKARLLTGGATEGCSIMRRIDAKALPAAMKTALSEAIETCNEP